MNIFYKNLKKYDSKLFFLLKKEILRQKLTLNLIASENYVSYPIIEVLGSQLTNKYAEGYYKNRFYGGCEVIDEIENLAINRAKKLFNVNYVNVQPHSGSQANFAVYLALLKPGDTILSLNLTYGGHITHGAKCNFSGKLFNIINYRFKRNKFLDFKKLAFKIKPKMIIGGFSSYTKKINWKYMRNIADEVGSYLMIDISHISGLIIANLYPNPINYAHVITTTTHKILGGPRGGVIMSNINDKNLYKKLDSSLFPGIQCGPLMNNIAAKAIVFKEAASNKFKIYQRNILKNSKLMSKLFIEKKFNVIDGITDTHMFVINLNKNNITGKKAEEILSLVNINVNKNCIPNESKKFNITSGIRIGTPSITKRKIKKKDLINIVDYISIILNDINNVKNIEFIKKKIIKLCYKYPIYK